jgi:hypothetical protein
MPSALSRPSTAVIRRAASPVASDSVAARVSTPRVSSAMSGRTLTRPVPLTEIAGAASPPARAAPAQPAATSTARPRQALRNARGRMITA